MRKLILGLAGLAVLVAAGWSAYWVAGRGTIEQAIEHQIARQDAAGWSLSIGTQQISGFPFRYETTLGDIGLVHRDSGTLIRLPELAISAVSTGGPLTMRTDQTIQIDQPVTQTMLLRDPSLPRLLSWRLDPGAAHLTLPHDGLAEGLEIRTEAMRLMLDQADYHSQVTYEAEAVRAVVQINDTQARMTFTADRNTLLVALNEPDSPPARIRFEIGSPDYQALLAPPEGDLLARMLRDGVEGQAKFIAEGTGAVLDVDIDESASDGFHGRISARTDRMDLQAEALPGQVSVNSNTEKSHWQVQPEGQQTPVLGTLTIDKGAYFYRLPTRPGPEAAPGDIAIEMTGVTGDDVFWQQVDPERVLDRAPGTLDLLAKLMLVVQGDGTGRGLSYAVTNVALDRAVLSLFGARAEATGDVDILQPLVLPLGEIRIRSQGLVGLLGKLEAAGLLPPAQREMGDAILQVYARPTGEPDGWETDLSFGNEGLSVNGIPVR